MKKQHFIEVLKNPSLLDEKTLEPIKEVLEEYPFFQAGRMLWIKNLHQLDHIRYNNELKLAAAHISDRVRLFELIQTKISETYTHEPLIEQKKPVVEPKKEVESSTSSTIDKKTADDFENANYFQVDDVYITPYGTEYDYSHREFNTPENQIEKSKRSDDNDDGMILPTGDLLEYELTTKNPYQLPSSYISGTDNELHSFSDWLNVLKQDHYKQPDNKSDTKKPVRRKKDLIDSFLEQRAEKRIKITPPLDETVENVDISLKSVQEHDDLMTETLANIFIQQKQFSKAIDVFRRLSLKYPEKNIYFARRISELEDNINN